MMVGLINIYKCVHFGIYYVCKTVLNINFFPVDFNSFPIETTVREQHVLSKVVM